MRTPGCGFEFFYFFFDVGPAKSNGLTLLMTPIKSSASRTNCKSYYVSM
jgi:hypothetical protein